MSPPQVIKKDVGRATSVAIVDAPGFFRLRIVGNDTTTASLFIEGKASEVILLLSDALRAAELARREHGL